MGKQMIGQNPRGTESAGDLKRCSVIVTPGLEVLKLWFPLPWSAQLHVDTATRNLSDQHGDQALTSVSAKAEAALVVSTGYDPILAKKGDV